jgi:L-alanine-DL-glutamate epimerase-like enolase superfamily enzyme
MSQLQLTTAIEHWPIAGTFTISRGSKREAAVIVATLDDGSVSGRGECVPYARYGETLDNVLSQIRSAESIVSREDIARILPAGAARNALDCAMWDLEAKRSGIPAAIACALPPPAADPLTCYTLSLDTADTMATRAKAAADMPLLKLKLGGGRDDAARLRAVRAARPDVRLVVDANEAWTPADLALLLPIAAEMGVELIEQPLPSGDDEALRSIEHLVPICADESVHTSADIERLAGLYDAVNIKLDKAGGLTEAVAMAHAAKAAGLGIMVGCMVSTSLAMAPALLLAGVADWLDLDGPLLLARDRDPAISYSAGRVQPASCALWG